MASGAQRKYDNHYELNFEVLQPPPKVGASAAPDQKPSVESPSQNIGIQSIPPRQTAPAAGETPKTQNKPEIKIASTDEFASEEIRSKIQPAAPEEIPPREADAFVGKEQPSAAEPVSAPRTPVTPREKFTAQEPVKQSTTPGSNPANQPQEKPMATSSPFTSTSNYARNVERQSKEQKSMNTILSGVGLFLLILVVLFGATAGFGGYVLWKEIQNQQVTVGRLDEKYAAAVSGLDGKLAGAGQEISALQQAAIAQRDEIVSLKTQLSAITSQLRNTQREAEVYKGRVQELERSIRNRTATTPR
ncbi:hypothetical protein QPK87_11400 [Kamptonema cortianum]|nr:hypothetical protein [Oscillatoria laete-virens]MDK3157179.1 hypothetical protein [Kamptonema cortianum]MDL5054431.1 hypothetical protein [Oscillatoria laete-virens NRMC-F 0139]